MGKQSTKFASWNIPSLHSSALLGSLCSNEGDDYGNDTERVKSRCFKIFRDYSISFNSSIAGNFVFLELDCKDRIEVQEKNKKVVVLCLRSPQNVEFHVVVVQWRQRNVQKSVMQVKSFFFLANLNLSLF